MSDDELKLLLTPGTWILLNSKSIYNKPFYVISAKKDGVFIGHPEWLVSDAIFLSWEHLMDIQLVWRGSRRWWWRFVPWRDLLCPFTKPHN